jgi:hypothetical protein
MKPVKKIPLIISGDEGAVYIDELPEGGAPPPNNNDNQAVAGNPGGNPNNNGNRNPHRHQINQMLALQSQMLSIRRMMEELRATQDYDRISRTRQYQTLNANI